MVKLADRLKLKQIIVLIKRLPQRDKLKLLRELEQETWASKLEEAVSGIRNRVKESQITDSDIDRIVEEVRERRYQARSSRLWYKRFSLCPSWKPHQPQNLRDI